MRIGYACRHQTLPTSSRRITYTNFKKLTLKQQIHKLYELTECNLEALENILIDNIYNDIRMFRVTSGLFPLSNHPDVIKWWDPFPIFKNKLLKLGGIINDNNIRVSMHLPQFISLTSSNERIITNAYYDLKICMGFFNGMELKTEPDVILHVGGKYDDKKKAIRNLITNFNNLPLDWKNKIRFENDHNIYGTQEVYHICEYLKVPMILDLAHHKFNDNKINLDTAFEIFFKTWDKNLIPKIHISFQNENTKKHVHSDFIKEDDFMEAYKYLKYRDFDIMIESKKTNIALNKLKNNLKLNNIYLSNN